MLTPFWITKKRPTACVWKKDNDELYATACGNDFFDATETGNPVTDWATFCPYCGGKIELPKTK